MPATVRRAFYAMLAGAVMSAVGVVVTVIQMPQTIDRAVKNAGLQTGTKPLDHRAVHDIAYVSAAAAVVMGVLQVGLWIWMAFANRAGKNWARVTSTVFFGISTLSTLVGLMSLAVTSLAPSSSVTGLSASVSALMWVAGLGAVIQLWHKDSRPYFAPRPPVYGPYGYPPAGPYGYPPAPPYGPTIPGPYGAPAAPGPAPQQYGAPVPGQYVAPAPEPGGGDAVPEGAPTVNAEVPVKNSWSTGEPVPPQQ
ncbi:hypothetical protein EBN03_01915 [Nocardia stercoris]|uniref:Uncharacterized protein n=1 Tax=Nocardia stercoris TaxID=2483361 RepID=A0A3M2LC34_9NOCA|nr:hypothetical protein EBN03_01915 [Nocardia stercoris]